MSPPNLVLIPQVVALQALLCTTYMMENMSDNSPTTKKRKANDGRATVPDGGSGGLFSSWLGYFSAGRRDDTPPTAQSTTCGGSENLTQKMDAMMQMMSRMEERQLANMRAVGSLERRCENLEAECSSLKDMLKTKMEQDDSKFDSLVRHHLFNNTKAIDEIIVRQFEYNNMLVKNQSWEYSTPVQSAEYWQNNGYDEDVAEYLADCSECLEKCSIALRRPIMASTRARTCSFFCSRVARSAVSISCRCFSDLFSSWS